MLTIILSLLAVVAIAWALAYHRANALAWSAALAAGAACLALLTPAPAGLVAAAWTAVALFAAFSVMKPLRRAAVTGPLFEIGGDHSPKADR